LNLLPFDEDTTTGLTLFGVTMTGACAGPAEGDVDDVDSVPRGSVEAAAATPAATPAAAEVRTN
jgi:hypothetical protein